MKKTILCFLTALAILATGCSDGSDEESQTPSSLVPGNATRPEWTAPNSQDYEQNMTVYLRVQDILLPYVSVNDLMCAKINGEVRGVGVPTLYDNEWLIPLVVFSDGTAPIQLSYYCDQLHRIYTIDWIAFDTSLPPVGEGSIYIPQFCN